MRFWNLDSKSDRERKGNISTKKDGKKKTYHCGMTSSWRQILVTYSIDMDKIPVVASFILNALCSLVFEYFISLFFPFHWCRRQIHESFIVVSLLHFIHFRFYHIVSFTLASIFFFLAFSYILYFFLSFIGFLFTFVFFLSFFLCLKPNTLSDMSFPFFLAFLTE